VIDLLAKDFYGVMGLFFYVLISLFVSPPLFTLCIISITILAVIIDVDEDPHRLAIGGCSQIYELTN
jgi:hypothetical protein